MSSITEGMRQRKRIMECAIRHNVEKSDICDTDLLGSRICHFLIFTYIWKNMYNIIYCKKFFMKVPRKEAAQTGRRSLRARDG